LGPEAFFRACYRRSGRCVLIVGTSC
jgi:hypothetical protein